MCGAIERALPISRRSGKSLARLHIDSDMDRDDDNSETQNAADMEPVETLGYILRSAREAQDFTLEKIADELRIEPLILEALESDRLVDLKIAPVFVKGYIKQYGRQLGLEYARLKAAYKRQVDADDITLQPNRTIQLRDERQITVWIVALIALIFVGVLLFVWVLLGDDDFTPVASVPTNDSSASVTSLAPSVPAATQALSDSNQRVLVLLPTDTADVDAKPEPEPEAGLDAVTEVTAQVAELDDIPTQTALLESDLENIAESPELLVVDASPVASVGSVEVVFTFLESSWLELTDTRNGRMYYDLGQAGAVMRFNPVPPANVLLGNADVVAITVNGADYAIPTQARRGNLASFVLSAPRN